MESGGGGAKIHIARHLAPGCSLALLSLQLYFANGSTRWLQLQK